MDCLQVLMDASQRHGRKQPTPPRPRESRFTSSCSVAIGGNVGSGTEVSFGNGSEGGVVRGNHKNSRQDCLRALVNISRQNGGAQPPLTCSFATRESRFSFSGCVGN